MTSLIAPAALPGLLVFLVLTVAVSAAVTLAAGRVARGRVARLAPALGGLAMPALLAGFAVRLILFYPDGPPPNDGPAMAILGLLGAALLVLPLSTAASVGAALALPAPGNAPRRETLRIVGIVAGAAIALQILALAASSAADRRQRERADRRAAEYTRTTPYPLSRYETDLKMSPILADMRRLRGLEAMSGDGFRIFALPTPRTEQYAVALYLPRGSDDARGELVVTRGGRAGPVTSFSLDRWSYSTTAAALHREAAGFPGYADRCFDGTFVAFEQVRGGAVGSGSGSVACSAHYAAISAIVLRGLARAVPRLPIPAAVDWHGGAGAAQPAGRMKTKRAPSPAPLSIATSPPIARASRREM